MLTAISTSCSDLDVRESPSNSLSKSSFWHASYQWELQSDTNTNNNNNNTNDTNRTFITQSDSCSSLPVSDPISTEPVVSISSGATSNQVIPPSSPFQAQNADQVPNPVLFHHCHDPITCTYRERRRRSILASTHSLSYLPPFRPREHISNSELRARRLCTYFRQYPRRAPAAIIKSTNSGKQTRRSRARARQSRPYYSQLNRNHTRSNSQPSVSGCPHESISDTMMNPNPISPRSRSCAKNPVNVSPGSTVKPSSLSRDTCHLNPAQSSLSSLALEPSTEWSIGILCTHSSSHFSSSSSIMTLPHRVTGPEVLPSPYVNVSDLCISAAENSVNLHDNPLSNNLSSTQCPKEPCLPGPGLPDLMLPDPPPQSDIQSLTSGETADWPPTPLDLLPCSFSMMSLASKKNKGKYSICHPVVNISIIPSSEPCQSSVSTTIVSPPTEIALTDSVAICPNRIGLFQLDRTLDSRRQTHAAPFSDCFYPNEPVDNSGDRSRPYTSKSEKSSKLTYRLGSRSNSPFPTNRQNVECGDCSQTNPLCSPSSMLFDCKTYSRQTDALPPQNPCMGLNSDMHQQAPQSRIVPRVNTLRTPNLSAVYASISPQPLSVTRRAVHQQYSTSLDCIASRNVTSPYDWAKSRPDLGVHIPDSICSHLFAIPDVSGLQKAVSSFGSPISPAVLASWRKSDRGSVTGTHGRPTDRRLYRVLQHYPGSRAEMLQEVQHAHGQHYAFLVLHTPAWNNMLLLVRDLDRSYPHWQLARQLQRSRKVFIRAASITRSTLGLNQVQPVLSQPGH